jgi:hypothetical protein
MVWFWRGKEAASRVHTRLAASFVPDFISGY